MGAAAQTAPARLADATGIPAELVRADGLAVAYGSGPLALAGVTFTACAGQRIGVLGPNGGGKTTLLRVLTGDLTPRAGSLSRPGRCGVVPQTDRSRLDFPVTALDVALMGSIAARAWWRRPRRADREAARRALREVGLGALEGSAFGSLSGGQRQRVLVARALVQDSAVIVLDEPFTGVDGDSAARLERLFERLASQGRVLLIATHDVRQARGFDRVLCLNRRQVAFGPPGEVLTDDVLARTYGPAPA